MRVLGTLLFLSLTTTTLVFCDRFRTVVVDDDIDWGKEFGGSSGADTSYSQRFGHGSTSGDTGCVTCDFESSHGGFSSSSQRLERPSSHSQRRTHSFSANDLLSGAADGHQGLGNRRGGRTRTSYKYSSQESTYSFSNGTHETTITSKQSSDDVAEFHLKMVRLSDGAVLEDSVLTEAEYAARRRSLGLTGSDGSFGRETLGARRSSASERGSSRTSSTRSSFGENRSSFDRGYNSERDSSLFGSRGADDFFGSLGRRFGGGSRGSISRGGSGRSSTTRTFSSEESFYSFSNGTHTTAIRGKKNSDGVKEYHLELIRNSDDAVLDRATISEAEYDRRRKNMSSGRGFDGVFDQHRGGGSRTHSSGSDSSSSSTSTRGGFSSSTRSSDRDTTSVIGERSERCVCVDLSQCSPSGMVGWSLTQCSAAQVCCRPSSVRSRPVAPSPTRPPSRPSRPDSGSSSRRTSFSHREEEETRTDEVIGGTEESCSCVSRVQCRYGDRVRTPAALRKCSSGDVCCRPTEEPQENPVLSPRRSQDDAPTCRCVERAECTYSDREFTSSALALCRYPQVCCKSSPQPSPSQPRPTPTPRRTRPTPRRVSQEEINRDRELFDDILQHVDHSDTHLSNEASRQLHASRSSVNDLAPTSQRTVEHHRTSSSRTETVEGDAGRQLPLHSTNSGRRFTYSNNLDEGRRDGGSISDSRRYSSGSSRRHEDFNRYSQQSEESAARRQQSQSAGGVRDDTDRRQTHTTRQTEQHLFEPDDLPGAVFRITTNRNTHRTVSHEDAGEHGDAAISGSHHQDRRGHQLSSSHFDSSRSHQQPVPTTTGDRSVTSSRRTSYVQSSSSSSDNDIDSDSFRAPEHTGFPSGSGGHDRRYDSSGISLRRIGITPGGGFHLGESSEPAVGGGHSVTSSRSSSSRRTYSSSGGTDHDDDRDLDLDLGDHDITAGFGHTSGSHFGASHSDADDDDESASGSSYRSSYSARRSSSSSSYPVQTYGGGGGSYDHPRMKRGLFSSGVNYIDPRGDDACACVAFYECRDGNIMKHGADLLDIWVGPRKQCKGFKVCCELPAGAMRHLQASPNHQSGVMRSVSTSGLSSFFTPAPASARPCVCVSSYLCDPVTREIQYSQSQLIDMRFVSTTGRCNYGGQVCCAVPESVLRSTPTHSSCQCTAPHQCSSHDVVTVHASPVAAACSATGQVCCSRPVGGHTPGLVPGGHSPGLVPGGHSPGLVPGGHSPGLVPGGHSPGLVPGGFNPGLVPGGYNPGLVPGGHRPGMTPGGHGAGSYPGGRRDDYDVYQFCKSYPLSVACGGTNPFARLPTIRATPYFNPNADAQRLKSAIGYWNADDEILIEVLCHRTFTERAQIKQAYARLYGKDLYEAITSSTRGKFENLMQELLEAGSYYEYLAKKLHQGMDRIGTDEDTVLETLISSTNEDIAAIKPFFHAIEGKTLIGDVEDDLTGDLEDIMVALVNGTRDGSLHVDRYRAREQAQALYRAGKGGTGFGTEEDTFKYYLTTQNYAQLALVFAEYEQLSGENFEEALEDEFSRHVEDAVQAIVMVTRNLPKYFAERLHDALWGRGPFSKDDSSLRRILISRAEIDLGNIAQEYHMKYGRTLIDDIEKKTTGDYEDGLVALCGGTS